MADNPIELQLTRGRLGIDGNNQQAEIRDSLTHAPAGPGKIFFDRNAPAQDIAVCPDIDGNGNRELAMLGRRSNGSLTVIVKDAKTGAQLGLIDY